MEEEERETGVSLPGFVDERENEEKREESLERRRRQLQPTSTTTTGCFTRNLRPREEREEDILGGEVNLEKGSESSK